MKFKKALRRANELGLKLKSESLGMSKQTPDTLVFWLRRGAKDRQQAIKRFLDYLEANDWELES